MRKIELSTTCGKKLYEGYHSSIKNAVEYAASQNIPLDGINLKNCDLHHINLDGVILSNACFENANLSGANLSEACFTACNFDGASLEDACLCYTEINNCNFKYTHFKGADFAMSRLESCNFHGFQALLLPYHLMERYKGLTYHMPEKSYPISTAPILISCGKRHIAMLGNTMIYNDLPHTFGDSCISESMVFDTPLAIQSMVDFLKKLF